MRASVPAGRDLDAPPPALVLAATDPANPYGAALGWPARPEDVASGHKPGRKAGALVVLVDGALALYVERGGRTLLSWTDDEVVDAGGIGAARGLELYLPLWLSLMGSFGTPSFNIAVVRADRDPTRRK